MLQCLGPYCPGKSAREVACPWSIGGLSQSARPLDAISSCRQKAHRVKMLCMVGCCKAQFMHILGPPQASGVPTMALVSGSRKVGVMWGGGR